MGGNVEKVLGIKSIEIASTDDIVRFNIDDNRYVEVRLFGDKLELRSMSRNSSGRMAVQPSVSNAIEIIVL